MPGVYKKKDCPQCGGIHRKKGKFCSQACSNSHREVSDKVRENMRKVASDQHGDPFKIAQGHLLRKGIVTPAENFAIEIPTFYDIPEGYETDFE